MVDLSPENQRVLLFRVRNRLREFVLVDSEGPLTWGRGHEDRSAAYLRALMCNKNASHKTLLEKAVHSDR